MAPCSGLANKGPGCPLRLPVFRAGRLLTGGTGTAAERFLLDQFEGRYVRHGVRQSSRSTVSIPVDPLERTLLTPFEGNPALVEAV